MFLPLENYDHIREIDIDEHSTYCSYRHWEDEFEDNEYISTKISVIKENLTDSFTRSSLVEFYKNNDVELETKFIATMIWGHEAPKGSRRDSRGPWKLSKMFSEPSDSQTAIRNVSINCNNEIIKSYKSLNKNLHRCGPNFFTKHFYFLGKSLNSEEYPVIFDDRVAKGLIKISIGSMNCLDIVNVSALRKADAYIKYLEFINTCSKKLNCKPDQLEYYLFGL